MSVCTSAGRHSAVLEPAVDLAAGRRRSHSRRHDHRVGPRAGHELEAALQQGAIVVMLGLGQIFLITAGNGNVDLSMPGVITLAGFAGIDVAANTNSIPLGLLAAIGVGLATGP